jgi:glycosyltransferase involved in cell wall biosynthesis
MKVLVISNMYPSSENPAYGYFVKEQVRCLNILGYRVKVIKDRGEGGNFLLIGKKYISLMFRSFLATLITKPDIIHAHYIFPPGFIGWICSIIAGCPLIVTSHRGDVYDMPYRHKLLFKLTRFSLRNAKRIVAVSTDIKNKMVYDFKINSEKIYIINMGVRILSIEKKKYFHNIPGTRKKLKVIFIGTSFKRKGGHVLIDAAEEVHRKLPGKMCYEFIGEKPKGIDSLIEQKGLKKYVDFKNILAHNETLERLKSADIFVLPSYSEGLPIAMLEAMSFGIAVIVTPVGDIPLVIKNMVNGLLVPVGDYRLLAEAILSLVNDSFLLQSIGNQAKKTAQYHSSYKKALDLTTIYNNCLSKS